eukprot:Amastigsp_a677625_213.p3 type:complete len:135 gc:universal Amastigsp_a677625_213:593-997(+)
MTRCDGSTMHTRRSPRSPRSRSTESRSVPFGTGTNGSNPERFDAASTVPVNESEPPAVRSEERSVSAARSKIFIASVARSTMSMSPMYLSSAGLYTGAASTLYRINFVKASYTLSVVHTSMMLLGSNGISSPPA